MNKEQFYRDKVNTVRFTESMQLFGNAPFTDFTEERKISGHEYTFLIITRDDELEAVK